MFYFIFGASVLAAFKLSELSNSESKAVVYTWFVLAFIVSFIVIGALTTICVGEV